MVKFSVVMPVYNVEQYIDTAIRSVLNQTCPDFELLIVDDGSTDGSIEIARRRVDPRIRIITQSNRGLAGARNTGIQQALGEFIGLLDSDDLWLPEKLESHLAHLEREPEVGISFSRSAFIDEQGRPLGYYQMPKLTGITVADILCRNPIGNGSSPVIRRQVFEEICSIDQERRCYFDEQFRQSEDIECWLRIAILTHWRVEGLSAPLTLYRVNAGGLSASIPRQLAAWERVVEKTRSYAPALIEEWGTLARAYQLRYLSRRAVRLQQGALATQLVMLALQTDRRILRFEPQRTIASLLAAYSQLILPESLFKLLQSCAFALTSTLQRRTIASEANLKP